MAPTNERAATQTARRAILDLLNSKGYQPVAQKAFLHALHVGKADRAAYRDALSELLRRGEIVELSRGRLAATESEETEGRLQRTSEGHGWVSPGGGEDAVFVPAAQLQGTLSGDRVRVRKGTGRRGGRLLDIVERRRRDIAGVVQVHGNSWTLRSFDSGIGPLNLPAKKRKEAKDNDAVIARIEATPEGDQVGSASVLKVFGPFGDPGVDIQVVCHRFNLAGEFPADALAEAELLPSRIGPAQKRSRQRFDDPSPVTIDGITAQDFDDAIAVKKLPAGRFRLWIHIADVAHFVRPGTALDREARRRGTSVYFPGAVVPMFPEKISNDLCSLRPEVDRLVQSVILDLEADGELRKVQFADGVIHSAARLTYSQVAEHLEGKAHVKGISGQVGEMLRDADELRQVLEGRRARRGSIDFDLPRPTILLDVEGEMTGIQIEPRNHAHRLIEECMLAANEAVAGHHEKTGTPCMYRIHEEPDPTKLERLVDFARAMGIAWPTAQGQTKGSADPTWIPELLKRFEGKPEQIVVQQLTLRTMMQARYSMNNAGHFGLAAQTYCHFTSPIRRYPDLVVHRLLRGQRGVHEGGANDSGTTDFDALAESCSNQERNAEAAERELLLWKKTAYIAGNVGEVFAGVVTGVAAFGLFVQLTESHVDGLLRVESLGQDDRWDLDEVRQRWTARRTGKMLGLGDAIQVRVDRVDRILRRVDFSLEGAGMPRSTGTKRSARPVRPGTARPAVPGGRTRRDSKRGKSKVKRR